MASFLCMWEVTNGMLLLQVALSVCLSAICSFESLCLCVCPTLITVSMSKCQTLYSWLSVYSSICLLPACLPACLLSVSMPVYWVVGQDGCRFECLLNSSVCLCVCVLVCLFVCLCIGLLVCLRVCLSICPLVCLLLCLIMSVTISIYSFLAHCRSPYSAKHVII